MPKLFLSYAREDAGAVESLYDRLKAAECEPWMDRRDILPGHDWSRSIFRAIREADFIVVCLSPNSVNKRGYVQREIKEALDLWKEKLDDDIYLIPARLGECTVPESLARFQWVDLFAPAGFDRLVQATHCAAVSKSSGNQGTTDRLAYTVNVIDETDPNALAYTMRLEYPQFSPIADSSIREINERLTGFVRRMALRFRKESLARIESPEEHQKARDLEWWRDDLRVSFAVHLITTCLITAEYSISTYGAGAAHPNSHTRTFNFRRHPAIELDLSDIFEPSSDYLRFLSEYCMADLRRQRNEKGYVAPFDEQWLQQGAAPTHENFTRWVFTPRGMQIIFDPYTVDCYAAGRQEVELPAQDLTSILKTDFARMLSQAPEIHPR